MMTFSESIKTCFKSILTVKGVPHVQSIGGFNYYGGVS